MGKSVNVPQEFWVGMPDFEQSSQKPFAKINVAIRNEKDLEEFSKLIGQKLTPKTKSVWFPELEPSGVGKKRWK